MTTYTATNPEPYQPLTADMLTSTFDALDRASIVALGFTPKEADYIISVSQLAEVSPIKAAKLLRYYQNSTSRTIKVPDLRKTCESCPAQWEGVTEDRKYVYIRYRHGFLSVEVGGEEILATPHGEDWCGVMTDAEMIETVTQHIGNKITFPHRG